MSRCLQFTLPEAVDLYYIDNEVSKKKYFKATLVTARFVFNEIFKNTLWETLSEWRTVQTGDPYDYIIIPKNAERIFSVGVQDDCGSIVPLFYNNRLNVVKKPTEKRCGCTTCNCAGLCESVGGLTTTTKLMFTINGIEYYEKTWLQVCSNGDVLQWTETPTKKYNNLTGDGGDFNDDYNDDYSTASAPFSDYTIVTVTAQKKICHIKVAPCGCPVETEENIECFNTFCGGFLDCTSVCKKKYCDNFLQNPNNNYRGEVKVSPCGNFIYYKPSKNWKRSGNTKKIPDYLLINYQTNPENCGQNVLVPEYALQCLFDGIDWYKKKRKDKYNEREKLAAKYQFEDSRSRLILHLNPLNLEELSHIQSSKILW